MPKSVLEGLSHKVHISHQLLGSEVLIAQGFVGIMTCCCGAARVLEPANQCGNSQRDWVDRVDGSTEFIQSDGEVISGFLRGMVLVAMHSAWLSIASYEQSSVQVMLRRLVVEIIFASLVDRGT